MADRPESGSVLGIPYNFERPSLRRLISAYWRPGEGMLVEKPFGVGYTLNLANWRSWLIVGLAAALLWHDRSSKGADDGDEEGEPVEVVIDDD